MKNILIFIDSSLGELDWIAPFLTSKYGKEFQFTLFFKSFPVSQKIIQDFNLQKENITLLSNDDVFYSFDKKYEKIIRYLLKKTKKFQWFHQKILQYQYRKVSTKISIENKFDAIFRDFNLKDSLELHNFMLYNPNAKIVVFPHAVGIQRIAKGFEDSALPSVDTDLWLENTPLSTRALPQYKDVFFAAGIPMLDKIVDAKQNNYDFHSDTVFILTRDSYKEFGTTREGMLNAFTKALEFCQKYHLDVIVKHHPRDKKLYQYRDIQKQFQNVTEYDKSLTNIDVKLRACLSVYSTAGIFFTAMKVPVFDFTPYHSCKEKNLIFHYCGDDGIYTHDLVEIGVQNKISDFQILLDEKGLNTLSSKQFAMLKKHFPLNANENIANKLRELT